MRKVLNKHTGKLFGSVQDAAKSCDGDPSTISKVCNGRQKTHRGFGWEYIEDTEYIKSISGKKVRLVISDTQAPAHHPDTFNFLEWICDEFGVTDVTHIGDETDNACASLFARNPELLSESEELEQAYDFMQGLYGLFDEMTLCNSNHGDRPFRNSNLHPRFIRSPGEVFEAPETFKWADQWIHEGVLYHHGHFKGHGNINPAIKFAVEQGRSAVIGHRPCSNIHYQTSKYTGRSLFGMSVGALVDKNHPMMNYGKYSKDIPIGAGVVVDGVIPFLVPMNTHPVTGRWDYKKKLF